MIIWLASYPRSGNTLLRLVLNSVFDRKTYSKHDDATDIGADGPVAAEVGHQFLGETWGQAYQRMLVEPQIHLVKTHDAPEDHGKAIYIVRDGRSSCRSYYHYFKDFPHLDYPFTMCDVVAGFIPFGSWGAHLDAWNPGVRPDTLLLKYENLVSDPATEIQRIAEFTGFQPLHDWQNNFERLHQMNPRFFRAGASNDPATALEGDAAAIFWQEHGDWMSRLGYPSSAAPHEDARAAYRKFISAKGNEYFNFRERVFLAETELATLRSDSADSNPALARDSQASDGCERETKLKHLEQMGELRRQLANLNDEWVRERERGADLQQRLDEANRLAEVNAAQRSAALAERGKAVDVLTGAMAEMNSRMRMLLSSRFLKLGWRLGFGVAPVWADPLHDDMAHVAEQLSRQAGHNGTPDEATREIVHVASKPATVPDEMDRALQHLADKGFRPRVVLDIGSAKGYWTQNAAWLWKSAEFFMIDPLQESEPELQKMCQGRRFHYILTAVGNEPGELVMNVTPDCDGSSLLEFPNPDPDRMRRVPIETIDHLLDAGKVRPPQLVKLDVQGFEMKVLEGGQKLFNTAEVFIIEVNFFAFMPGCPRVYEVVKYMADRGFYPFDFAGFLRRPYEDDLGQADIVFVKNGSPMVSSNRWA